MKWTPQQTPSQSGKIIVITGANSGIGFEAARQLAACGAHVVLCCRSQAKADEALARIRALVPQASLSTTPLELDNLQSVRAAAATIARAQPKIDVLINNAGVMALPRRMTKDGFEMQLGTNHLGHFAFTGLLLAPLLQAHGRVVSVSSIYHRSGRIDFEDLMGERAYKRWAAYSQSKLANLLFTFELQRRATRAGRKLSAVACHPGYAGTNLQFVGPEMDQSPVKRFLMRVGGALVAQSAEHGAWPTVRAATEAGLAGGEYFGPGGIAELRGAPKVVKAVPAAHDEAVAARLWETSETLTGVRFSFNAPG